MIVLKFHFGRVFVELLLFVLFEQKTHVEILKKSIIS